MCYVYPAIDTVNPQQLSVTSVEVVYYSYAIFDMLLCKKCDSLTIQVTLDYHSEHVIVRLLDSRASLTTGHENGL